MECPRLAQREGADYRYKLALLLPSLSEREQPRGQRSALPVPYAVAWTPIVTMTLKQRSGKVHRMVESSNNVSRQGKIPALLAPESIMGHKTTNSLVAAETRVQPCFKSKSCLL